MVLSIIYTICTFIALDFLEMKKHFNHEFVIYVILTLEDTSIYSIYSP